MRRFIYLLILLFLLIFILFRHFSSAPTFTEEEVLMAPTVTLSDIRKEIDEFANHPVVVEGYVTESFYTGFLGGGWFCVQDGSDVSLRIFSRKGLTPAINNYEPRTVVPKIIFRHNEFVLIIAAEHTRQSFIKGPENPQIIYSSN